MKKVEGVIFDWAGTAVDFGCFAPVHVFITIFEQAGITVTMEEAREPMGMLKIDHVRAMLQMPRIAACWEERYGRPFTEDDVHTLYEKFEPLLMESLAQYTNPIPHVLETVETLRAEGLKIGSTTGYTDSMMNVVVKHAAQKGYAPDFYVTADATSNYGRPYPYMIYRNFEQLKLTTSWQVVKVGDTASDIQEAIQAGVWAVGVCVGSSEMGLTEAQYAELTAEQQQQAIENVKQAFFAYGADFAIDTMAQLPNLLTHINEQIALGQRPQRALQSVRS